MITSNYTLFLSQLEEAVQKYPNLTIKESDGKKYIKGVLDIPDDNNVIIGSFLIEIYFSKDFPYSFPKLYETGGSIPNEADWHKYRDGSCCITVESDEVLKCKYGIDVISFIELYAIPFFANQIHRKAFGKYKNGEYSHGYKGQTEFYTELLGTNDTALWKEYFHNTFRKHSFNKGRNKSCLCGSKKKYKRCHLPVFGKLWAIGEPQVLKDFNNLLGWDGNTKN